MLSLPNIQQAYFIGIGGIGMSALARYFRYLGIAVAGYDRTPSPLTADLEREGMAIHYSEDLAQVPAKVDLVVYTPAVPAGHLELQHFRAAGVPVLKRAEVLGLISRSRRALAVAGTHGKTTTSSILAHLLRSGGLDCTAFLGGIANNWQSNFVQGNSDWVVVEADEFDRSFLHLQPDMAIITSADPDHLDIYGDAAAMRATYAQFAGQVGGLLAYRYGLPIELPSGPDCISYGTEAGADYRIGQVRAEGGFFVFDLHTPQGLLQALRFSLPGLHNVENAAAAIVLALHLGIGEAALREALESFAGIKRRFEWVWRGEGRAYIDDYAHHPTELRAAIAAARALFPERRLTGIFQPHLYSRTRDFAEGFAEALEGLDEVLLLDIYPARELPIEGVASEMIFDQIRHPHKVLLQKSELLGYMAGQRPEVLLTLGAGDIDRFVAPLRDLMETQNTPGQ